RRTLDSPQAPRLSVPFPGISHHTIVRLTAEQHRDAARRIVGDGLVRTRRRPARASKRPCSSVPLPGLAVFPIPVFTTKKTRDPSLRVIGHCVPVARRWPFHRPQPPRPSVPLPRVVRAISLSPSTEQDGPPP